MKNEPELELRKKLINDFSQNKFFELLEVVPKLQKNFPKSFNPHLILHGAIECMKKYYHYLIYELEDVELGSAYLNTIRIMDRDYEQMFIDRQLLQAQQRQQDRRRRRREN